MFKKLHQKQGHINFFTGPGNPFPQPMSTCVTGCARVGSNALMPCVKRHVNHSSPFWGYQKIPPSRRPCLLQGQCHLLQNPRVCQKPRMPWMHSIASSWWPQFCKANDIQPFQKAMKPRPQGCAGWLLPGQASQSYIHLGLKPLNMLVQHPNDSNLKPVWIGSTDVTLTLFGREFVSDFLQSQSAWRIPSCLLPEMCRHHRTAWVRRHTPSSVDEMKSLGRFHDLFVPYFFGQYIFTGVVTRSLQTVPQGYDTKRFQKKL